MSEDLCCVAAWEEDAEEAVKHTPRPTTGGGGRSSNNSVPGGERGGGSQEEVEAKLGGVAAKVNVSSSLSVFLLRPLRFLSSARVRECADGVELLTFWPRLLKMPPRPEPCPD
jgi:hypothetical protein